MAVKLWVFLMLSSASQRAENRSKVRGVLRGALFSTPTLNTTTPRIPRHVLCATTHLLRVDHAVVWLPPAGRLPEVQEEGGKKKNARRLAHPGAEASEAAASSSRDVRTDRGAMSLSWHRQKDVPGSFLCTAGGFPRGRGVIDGQAVPGSRLSEGSVRDRTPDVGRAAEI